MTVSQKDLEFMQRVAEAFRKTRTDSAPDGSVQAAAKFAGLSRTKAVKILVTMGELETPHTAAAMELRSQGKSIGEIAGSLAFRWRPLQLRFPTRTESATAWRLPSMPWMSAGTAPLSGAERIGCRRGGRTGMPRPGHPQASGEPRCGTTRKWIRRVARCGEKQP